MKLLIDTNVILDMVFKRSGCDISMDLFRKVKETGASAYITASSVTDIFYIIHKEIHDTSRTYGILENIFRLVAVVSVADEKYFYHISKTPCICCISLIYRLFLSFVITLCSWHIVV